MRNPLACPTLLLSALALVAPAAALHAQAARAPSPRAPACLPGEAGAPRLAPGFCAMHVADVARPRHLAVADNGDLYVSFQGQSGAPTPAQRGGVVVLRDGDGDGSFESRSYVGNESVTGVALRGGFLYAATNTAVLRYRLEGGLPVSTADTIVAGLASTPGEPTKSIAFADDGALLVSIGAATDACAPYAAPGTPAAAGPPQRGEDPCGQLQTRAGIWRFDPTRTGQRLDGAERWATGIRNAVALASHPTSGAIYAVSHGRSMLARWPGFTAQSDVDLPAEEFHRVERGRAYGWPYCYFDPKLGRLVLSPEYGGNGVEVGRCASFPAPIYAFPAHRGPNDLLFYTGSHLPARYRGGAFVALHARANPGVAFIPFANGRPSGTHREIASPQPGAAVGSFRPNGLAQAPDGSLYVAEDGTGRVWRIVYTGGG